MKNNQSDSLQNIDHTAVSEISPDDIINADLSEVKSSSPSSGRLAYLRCNIKKYLFIALLLISSSVFVYEINAAGPIIIKPPSSDDKPDDVHIAPFNFLVYCPESYHKEPPTQAKKEDDSKGGNDELRRRLLTYARYDRKIESKEDYNRSNLYIVEIRNLQLDSKTTQNISLFYCGLVRQFYGSCNDAKYLCSTPGPMFDLQTFTHTDIVWLNFLDANLTINTSDDDKEQCLLSNQQRCILEHKTQDNLDQTFLDPTKHATPSKVGRHMIQGKYWPISNHVHGAQVRPTFDGNPLSWFDNAGQRGIGALSLNDTCYYEQFNQKNDQSDKISFAPPQIKLKSFENYERVSKINRYPNSQNPGNLWYHDHAMRLTTYNVRHGLSGIYILRDPKVEKQIGVHVHHEKLIMLTVDGWRQGNLKDLQSDTVYRFRFLNNYFDRTPPQLISFSYKNCTDLIQNRIKFTIIGADSSLFHKGIYDQTSFVISQAERIELLAKFSCQQAIDNTLSICSGLPTNPTPAVTTTNYQQASIINTVALKFRNETTDPDHEDNTRNNITDVVLSVPYTNFTQIADSKIAVKRMRPLILANPLTINGRYDYHDGQSQNPVIGTYEDWYIINTMSFAHPIHIHLINFQVVNEFYLKHISYITTGADNKPSTTYCTFYQLDFIAQAIHLGSAYLPSQKAQYVNSTNQGLSINYSKICRQKSDIYNKANFNLDVQKVNVQNVAVNRISGIDLLKQKTPLDRVNLLRLVSDKMPIGSKDPKPSEDKYLYISNLGHPSPKPYYSQWKDTAYADSLMAFQFRIRWAKSDFKEEDENDPYFHVPADQLRQYPGYVYHCHILPHQDNEMMRPIMLQLPDDARLDQNVICNQDKDRSWAKKYQCINEQCKKKTNKL